MEVLQSQIADDEVKKFKRKLSRSEPWPSLLCISRLPRRE
ncbi:unnamed protein product [Spirodela intermedia]|uniref:Uncharacterized protein n=1 Tax=Spirodela intermedia TaxID=51605 RepID=A0A7I8IRF4_SPIIN|nr:unnamed protein product [Spirodela intermedia]CAA6660342.1 unnamed protein product [Spirodela intermedia]